MTTFRWKAASSATNKNAEMAAFAKILAKSSNANVLTGSRTRSALPTSMSAPATAASMDSVWMELQITPVPACRAGLDGCKLDIELGCDSLSYLTFWF